MKVYGLDEMEGTSHWTKPDEMWRSQALYSPVSWNFKLWTVDGSILKISNMNPLIALGTTITELVSFKRAHMSNGKNADMLPNLF
jgi:hypothetical protein